VSVWPGDGWVITWRSGERAADICVDVHTGYPRSADSYQVTLRRRFREKFKGCPVKRVKRRGLLRNVAAALSASDDPAADYPGLSLCSLSVVYSCRSRYGPIVDFAQAP